MKYAPSKWQNDLRSSAHAAHLPHGCSVVQDEATLAAPAPRQHNGGEEHLLERRGSKEAAAGRRGLLSQKVLHDEASGDERREAADLTCCSSAQGTIFELAAFVAATTETAVRGFSLGFGYVLVKATLRAADRDEGPRSGHDFGPAYRFARMAGLGVACSFVGLSMFVPVGLRLGHRLA